MIKQITEARDFIERHGVATAVGIAFILGGMGGFLYKIATLAPEKATSKLSILGIDGGVSGLACIFGIGFMLEGARRSAKKQSRAGTITIPPREIVEVLGAVILTERNEAAREKVVRVEALTTPPDENQDKVDLHEVLKALYGFLSIGRDHVSLTSSQTRKYIDNILQRGRERGFAIEAYQHYLNGLRGLTYFVEDFTAENAHTALSHIEPTVNILRNEKREMRYGLATLLNAIGICHGILAGEEGISPEKALNHINFSRKAFKEQLDEQLCPNSATPLAAYRVHVNYAELAANLYWLWRRLPDEKSKELALTKLRDFVPDEFQVSREMFISKLFRSAVNDLNAAMRIAEQERLQHAKRPAVFVTHAIVGTALEYARADGVLTPKFNFSDMAPTKIGEHLKAAYDMMESELLPRSIKRSLLYSPVISEGILGNDSPSALRETRQFLEEKLKLLDAMEAAG